MSVKPKKTAESIAGLKAVGASETEASSAVALLQSLSVDGEAPNDVKCQATTLMRELQALPTVSTRREALMLQVASLAGKVA